MISSIIAYILLINLVLRVLFKADLSVFCCGIAAFSGKSNLSVEKRRMAMLKMKILGMFNESRGEHSCGIYLNGEIRKGIDKTKLFTDFISKEDDLIEEPDPGTPIILHTRQASVGARTEDNAHPFWIKADDVKDDIVLVHNGTMTNIWTLCTEHKINHSTAQVDSKGLAMLLVKLGPSILEQYKGDAALIYTKPTDPTSIYVYHGAHRHIKGGLIYEERPMYYMKTAEGIYFSSMKEPLYAIREGDDQKPLCLEYNHVYQVTNGKFITPGVKIDREDINVTYTYTPPVIPTKKDRKMVELPFLNAPEDNAILRETLPPRAFNLGKDMVFYHKGRHFKTGYSLCHGEMTLDKRGFVSSILNSGSETYYFHTGVMLKNKEDYDTLLRFEGEHNSWINNPNLNFAYHISRFSRYPVTNLESEGNEIQPSFRFTWYKNGIRCTDNVTPKFCQRHYSLDDGVLKSITSTMPDDKHVLHSTIEAAKLQIGTLGKESETTKKEPDIDFSKKEISLIKRDSNSVEGSSFDRVFASMSEAQLLITVNEIQAILFYAEDQLKKDMPVDPDDNEIDAYVFEMLLKAINNKVTIREVLSDNNYNALDNYLLIAQNPRMDIDKTFESKQEAIVDSETTLIASQEEIDDLIKRDIDKLQDDVQEEEDNGLEEDETSAEETMESVITGLESLQGLADELQANNSDFAQDCASVLYRNLTNLNDGLGDICGNSGKTSLLKELARITTLSEE